MSHLKILVSFTFFFLVSCWGKLYEETPPDEDMKQYDQGKHRVCLYHEWERPVESIETVEALNSLVPNDEADSMGAENNILLALYEDQCEQDAHNAIFIGSHYQTGPGVLHLAAMNKKVFPQIEADWELPSNCSHFVFIPKGSFYGDHATFQRLSDAS
ncbi:hypothetical protein RFI_21638 [Reticulomyxa filosa]|uniref:Uncharacterized protein n=1 Tax=Reticulomyxa filosa TaxID=46433 RepID=X6MQK2_RETFI|nr:hypothetical protein RFI_21638 [Reticulomyxa filosa]|eukprot:ETO15727.1 hypothetical protein RFI_21638 [Reticulomyxa filosa]